MTTESAASQPIELSVPDSAAKARLASTSKLDPGEKARYIKLGHGGDWEDGCFKEGTIRLGFASNQHEASLRGEWAPVHSYWASKHKGPGAVLRAVNQIKEFYRAPEDTVWMTIAHQHLWWCHAASTVEELDDGTRVRRVLGRWWNTDVNGNRLTIEALDGRLTTTASFRGTVCKVKHEDYAIRRLLGEVPDDVAEAIRQRKALVAAIEPLIRGLHWADFEVLTDLMFVRAGYQRLSVLGKTMKSKDLDLLAPVLNRRAFVQVKSSAGPKELRDAIKACEKAGGLYQDLFFVVHTSDHALSEQVPSDGLPFNVTVLDVAQIAELCVSSGLVDWLVKRRS